MSRGFQRVILAGHLGADPVVKAPQAGGLVGELRVAVTEVFKTHDGQRTEHTEWLRIKLFGRNAEIAQQYLKKGALVSVEGKIVTEKWQAGDGSDRYSQWIYCAQHGLHLLGGGRDHETTRAEHQGRAGQGASPPADDGFDDDEIGF